jgi:hypothetical protein
MAMLLEHGYRLGISPCSRRRMRRRVRSTIISGQRRTSRSGVDEYMQQVHAGLDVSRRVRPAPARTGAPILRDDAAELRTRGVPGLPHGRPGTGIVRYERTVSAPDRAVLLRNR